MSRALLVRYRPELVAAALPPLLLPDPLPMLGLEDFQSWYTRSFPRPGTDAYESSSARRLAGEYYCIYLDLAGPKFESLSTTSAMKELALKKHLRIMQAFIWQNIQGKGQVNVVPLLIQIGEGTLTYASSKAWYIRMFPVAVARLVLKSLCKIKAAS